MLDRGRFLEKYHLYFKEARDFLRTSLAYNILCGHQNVRDCVW